MMKPTTDPMNQSLVLPASTNGPRGLKSPPIGVPLNARQALASAFRILASEGWKQNLAGHITVVADESGNMLVNPWGKWWDEVVSSDLLLVSPDGDVLDGNSDVTPAIFIHTEVHRRRPDARVIIHNHPFYATLLAGLGILPTVVEQTGCMFEDEVALFNEYTGGIDNSDAGKELADAVGDATAVLLANHGVLITGSTIAEATYRAVSFERVCRLSVFAMMIGKSPTEIAPSLRSTMKEMFFMPDTVEFYWNGAVRLLLQQHLEVLD